MINSTARLSVWRRHLACTPLDFRFPFTYLRAMLLCVLLIPALILSAACSDSTAATQDHPTLHIASASAMRPVMSDLLTQFETIHPEMRTTITFGASGNLYAQITNRAPFDLFLASDTEYPDALVRDQHAVGPVIHYATGHLVLWTAHDSPLDLSKGIDALHNPALRRLAIATPRHAPYGRAAKRLLETLNVYDQLSGRLILGENVEQAAKFANTGAADAALIPDTIARQPAMRSGRQASVPTNLCPGVPHGAVILSRGQSNPAAHEFLDFLLTDTAHRILSEHGLTPAGSRAKPEESP